MFAVPPLPADLSSQPNHGTARNKKAIQLRRPLCNFSSQQLLPNELVLGGCQKHLELVENGSSNNKTRNANRKRQDAGEDQQRQQQHQRQYSQKRHRQGRHHHCQQNAHTCRTYNMMKATATTAKATHTHHNSTWCTTGTCGCVCGSDTSPYPYTTSTWYEIACQEPPASGSQGSRTLIMLLLMTLILRIVLRILVRNTNNS